MIISALTKYEDWETSWFQEGIKILRDPRPIYHRKQWELVSCIQSLKEYGMLAPGKKGLGFGVGKEKLPAIFASFGCQILATDQPPQTASDWKKTNQYCESLEELKDPNIISNDLFNQRVSFEYVDMNNLNPLSGRKFDFIWSICALEHLGTIERGIKFLENCIPLLNPNGVMFHTTEFNVSHIKKTQDQCSSVFFRTTDINNIETRLNYLGYTILPIDLSIGAHRYDWQVAYQPNPPQEPHLKVQVGDFIITCIRLICKPMTLQKT